MPHKSRRYSGLIKHIPLVILLIGLFVPSSVPVAAPTLEVIVEDPLLSPSYTTCPLSAWFELFNDRGHPYYLTLNVTSNSENNGEWHPVITQDGYYRVEAYIPGHSSINWCTSGNPKEHDSTDAHYSIHHAGGVSIRSLSQYPLSDQWLNLGEYYFNAGQSGYVSLTDLNGETDYTTTVSFSAMRFTFTRTTRPQLYLPIVHRSEPPIQPPSPNIGLIQAQGFDVCGLPSISKMQTWWNESPYFFYGLYLGGIQLPSMCATADAAWVSAVHQQGWSFVPTWVGLQAPCSPYVNKMSSDPAVSYQQGRQEAELASTAANSVGLTSHGYGGTVIYYDMEVFGGASLGCRQAASAFMNGWGERLSELGNIAGGYGAHNSYVEDWASIAHVPQDVWAASWYTDYYDPYASVLTVPWLDGLWINHQRIRQYSGDDHDSWGGIGIVIDRDVADGMVALPPSTSLAKPIVNSSPTVDDAGWLSTEQGWLVSGNRLYLTNDLGNNWQDVSPAPVQRAYFLPTGQAWALSTLDQEQTNLYISSDWGKTWKHLNLDLPPEDWWPLQLHFTSPTNGWIVLQKMTSQAFSSGILMKTSDAGLTWQTNDLPIAAQINFLSPDDGWIVNRTHDMAYHTSDGGLTWTPDPSDASSQSAPSLPDNAIFSGWQADGLGWAVTSAGSCTGKKLSPGFTCYADNALWQSVDSGQTWEQIKLPWSTSAEP